MKQGKQFTDNRGKVFHGDTEQERYKRYQYIQYRNLVFKSFLTFCLGVLFKFFFIG